MYGSNFVNIIESKRWSVYYGDNRYKMLKMAVRMHNGNANPKKNTLSVLEESPFRHNIVI